MPPTPRRTELGRLPKELEVAVDAAAEAGDLVRDRLRDSIRVCAKGDRGDVVTELDLLAEQIIVARLRDSFPEDLIHSEEAGTLGSARSGRQWLVDPLDGTNNVVIGLSACAIGVSLCEGLRPVLSVVHEPVTGDTWWAEAGYGAHGRHGPLTGPARPAARPVLAWTQGYAVTSEDRTARRLRAALEGHARRLVQLWAPLLVWGMLARGGIDGFIGYRPELIELPGGALLAAEAGLELRTFRGEPYVPALAPADDGFVAARPDMLPELLRLVAEAAPPG